LLLTGKSLDVESVFFSRVSVLVSLAPSVARLVVLLFDDDFSSFFDASKLFWLSVLLAVGIEVGVCSAFDIFASFGMLQLFAGTLAV
jgi:hypothetical protein